MNAASFLLVLVGVALNAAAQLLLKAGTNTLKTSPPADAIPMALRLATQPFLLGGVACCVAGLLVWVVVLSRVPVGVAYPLLSIGYVVNLFAAHLLFRESITPAKLIAVSLIVLGVGILATQGSRAEAARGLRSTIVPCVPADTGENA